MLFLAFTGLSKVMIMIHDMKQTEPFLQSRTSSRWQGISILNSLTII